MDEFEVTYDKDIEEMLSSNVSETSCADSKSIKNEYREMSEGPYELGKPQRITITGRITHG